MPATSSARRGPISPLSCTTSPAIRPVNVGSETGHHLTIGGPQHVELAVEVDDGQVVLSWREPQHALELGRAVGVDLRGQAGLAEPQLRQTQQGVVAGDALLEQGAGGSYAGRPGARHRPAG